MESDNGLYSPKPKNIKSLNLTPGELNKSEQSFYRHDPKGSDALSKNGLYKAEGAKSSAAHGLTTATNLTPWARAIRFAGQHKKGAAIGGGGATGLIIGILTLFGFIAAHELQTIEQDMLRYEDKAFSYVEKKAANKILQKMACRSGAALSGCAKAVEGEPSPESDTDPMAEEIDKFNFTDPNVETGLANQDIGVNTEGGKFSGLTDLNTGEPISASEFDNTDMIDRFQTAIPQWDVGQEIADRPLMTDDLSATFDVITSPEESDPNKAVEDGIAGDVSPQELADAVAEDENKPSSQSTTPAEQQQLAADQALTDTNNSLLQEADKGILNGESESQILDKAEGSVDLTAATAPQIIGDVCSVKQAATEASKTRIPKIIGFLVRHSTTLISLADEMKVGGSMSGSQISKITGLFNGESNSSLAKSDPYSSLPFNRSAAWQRIEGNTPNTNTTSSSYNPDMSSSLKPTVIAGTYVVNSVDSLLNHIGLNGYTCGAFTNTKIQGFLGLVQIVSGGISAELSTLIIGAVGITVQEFLQHQVIPAILKYFTPIAMDGLESSVQWMNNADAGSNLAINMFAQRLGGKPLSNGSATAMYNRGTQLQEIAQKQKSFFSRTFSFSNPDSLFSRLLVHLPLSRLGIIDSMFNEIINSPLALIHAIASIVEGPKVYAATQTNPGQPYDITQYGFDNSEINKYDPIINEHYLLHTIISYKNKSNTLIALLGNPNNYPNGTNDPSTTDVLHCFTQVYSSALNETAPDPICGSMGNYDSAVAQTPIGTSQIAVSFCEQLAPGDPKCLGRMLKTLSLGYPDLITHFRQYILDDEVTGYYSSLMNTQ